MKIILSFHDLSNGIYPDYIQIIYPSSSPSSLRGKGSLLEFFDNLRGSISMMHSLALLSMLNTKGRDPCLRRDDGKIGGKFKTECPLAKKLKLRAMPSKGT